MSEGCDRFEFHLAEQERGGDDSVAAAALREHASRCRKCSELLEVVEMLRHDAILSKASDPGDAYWADFDARLAGRLPRELHARPRWPVPSWIPRASLAAAASLLAVLALYGLRGARPGGTPAPRAGASAEHALESDLVHRLDQADAASLASALGDDATVVPPEGLDALAETLPGLDDLRESEASPYELFDELDESERGRLLKEMLGETG